MAGVRSTPNGSGKFQAWYIDRNGKREWFLGTTSRKETLAMAKRFDDEHRQVRLGYRPPPRACDKHKLRPFAEVAAEYVAWGEAQGGRGGRAWGRGHARMRRAHLAWWTDRLGLAALGDVDGILPRVEVVLRELQAKGLTGKTLTNYAEALKGLFNWCTTRGYLAEDPLAGLAPFDITPRSRRRAMTREEIQKLLDACPAHRRLLYEVALSSGLRAGELRALSIDDLDAERSGLRLDAAWTKNRQGGLQPLAAELVSRLAEFAKTGEAAELYSVNRRMDRTGIPARPLLYVPRDTAPAMEKDMNRAGVLKHAPGGKLDFHACRVAYVSFVLEAGASVREAMSLARHATADLTLNAYGRAREDRLAEVAEAVGGMVRKPSKRATGVLRKAEGA